MGIEPHDDLIFLLTQDHEAVKQRMAEFDGASAGVRAELFWKLTDQLIRHEVAEETIVYPALRKAPGGDALADARQGEEADAEQQLARMEKLDPTTEEFMGALRDLRQSVLTHAEREERETFPVILANEDTDSLVLLGQKFKSAKLAAPNHPHPHTPNTATANKLLGPIASFFDRVRDSVKTP